MPGAVEIGSIALHVKIWLISIRNRLKIDEMLNFNTKNNGKKNAVWNQAIEAVINN